MNRVLFLLLAVATTANAQLMLVPDNRVSVHTNNMIYLTNTVLQGDMAIIDTNLFKLYAEDVVLSNRITSVSNMVVGASNRADEAYTLALAATNISPSQQTYVYTVSNTVTLVAGTAGQTTFTVGTQDLARIQVGHYLGPTNVFSGAATQLLVSAVDRTSGSNLVTITGGGSLFATTNNVTITVTNAGSFTHTVPNGYSRCRVTVTGGGASGARTSGDGKTYAGGAGGTAIGFFQLTPLSTYDVTAGRAGPVPSSYANVGGSNGTLSSFGTLLTAYGGIAITADQIGAASWPLIGGAGGSAVGGTINLPGQYGDYHLGSSFMSRGGTSYWGSDSGYGTPQGGIPYGVGGNGVFATDGTPSPPGDGVVVIEYY